MIPLEVLTCGEELMEYRCMSNKFTATVKWFDTNKGFGFINGPDGDVFVHYRSIAQEGFKNLREGGQVQFIQIKSDRGWAAAEVAIVQ